ncbi:NAD(P)/FAD-dependent oxidoreductase [Salipiger sp. P9]|uniref:flavin-containing monooxygenase n=1 Tax=Salipiger pentaromativorans TaxID=2943193 RepID=UPI00215847D6|nr:NAD(P)/FAD-dependent oxidoreductase [Salipiger pentaromativorans]MCR8547570.1 NAD(P)/FAD-dependent oxidoreductase [Salipiger pentaromativorans]
MSNTAVETYDAVIIGAGFGGLHLLRRLRDKGHKVLLLEAGQNVGGVWYWNCYPGARVDSMGHMYQFSDPELWQDWDFTELYPGREEVAAYFDYVDKKLDLSKDIRFGTKVTSARFDEEDRVWTISAEDGYAVRARFLLPCLGFAAKPFTPDIPGMSDFNGVVQHTALWPQGGLDMTGKRIAVIGTGASGLQVVQEASKVAEQVTVFQRTAMLALPMRQRKISKEESAQLKKDYAAAYALREKTFGGFDFDFIPKSVFEVSDEERRKTFDALWEKGGFYPWLANYYDTLMDEKANRLVYDYWRDRTRERINDPRLAEILAPTDPPHPIGVKRPSLEQTYFECFNLDNVSLVNLRETPIERITETGIKTTEAEYPFDIIVLATGFDAISGGMLSIDIVGSNGRTIQERWSEGLAAHLGMATSEFPNMFMVYGPQSPSAFCNGPSCAEFQGDWVARVVDDLIVKGKTRIEATPEADETWRSDTVQTSDMFYKANSWYIGANIPGKRREMMVYARGIPDFLQRINACVDEGYSGFVVN